MYWERTKGINYFAKYIRGIYNMGIQKREFLTPKNLRIFVIH